MRAHTGGSSNRFDVHTLIANGLQRPGGWGSTIGVTEGDGTLSAGGEGARSPAKGYKGIFVATRVSGQDPPTPLRPRQSRRPRPTPTATATDLDPALEPAARRRDR